MTTEQAERFVLSRANQHPLLVRGSLVTHVTDTDAPDTQREGWLIETPEGGFLYHGTTWKGEKAEASEDIVAGNLEHLRERAQDRMTFIYKWTVRFAAEQDDRFLEAAADTFLPVGAGPHTRQLQASSGPDIRIAGDLLLETDVQHIKPTWSDQPNYTVILAVYAINQPSEYRYAMVVSTRADGEPERWSWYAAARTSRDLYNQIMRVGDNWSSEPKTYMGTKWTETKQTVLAALAAAVPEDFEPLAFQRIDTPHVPTPEEREAQRKAAEAQRRQRQEAEAWEQAAREREQEEERKRYEEMDRREAEEANARVERQAREQKIREEWEAVRKARRAELGEVLSRGRSDDVGALIAIAANLELLRMDLEDGTCKIEVPQTNSYGEVDW